MAKQSSQTPKIRSLWLLAAVTLAALSLTACENNMRNQPHHEALEYSAFFPDGQSSRPLEAGVIPTNRDVTREWFYSGKSADGRLVDAFPAPVTIEVLQRGEERFNIFCSPCHGFDGKGGGMIVQRGFANPPDLTSARFQSTPVGHFVNVIQNGFGQMYAYGYRVKPDDRWAIAAYIRALQFSQNAPSQQLPPDILDQLNKAAP